MGPRGTGLSWRSRSVSVACRDLFVSARTFAVIESNAFFDG
jgi:hypothetical protein